MSGSCCEDCNVTKGSNSADAPLSSLVGEFVVVFIFGAIAIGRWNGCSLEDLASVMIYTNIVRKDLK
jgi:hypothetical protein